MFIQNISKKKGDVIRLTEAEFRVLNALFRTIFTFSE